MKTHFCSICEQANGNTNLKVIDLKCKENLKNNLLIDNMLKCYGKRWNFHAFQCGVLKNISGKI